MQKLLWLGNPYFASELANMGWQIKIADYDGLSVLCWQDLVEIAGFEPDCLVIGDKSLPPVVLGMENFPCLTVFYSVDSHIHSWHPHYAQGFDAALVSLHDHLTSFTGIGLPAERIWWSPPFASDSDQPDWDAEKFWDCLFVGTVKPDLMPRRVQFLQALAKDVPGLHVTTGNYRKLFPHGRVLINQAANGDLNFRVFEAMACGGCLVTPRINNGLDKLFVDGEHMVGYRPDDPGDAAYRINFLLDNPDLQTYIGQTAYAEINAKHRARHRAEAFTDHLCDLMINDPRGLIQRRRERSGQILRQALAIPYLLWAKETEIPALQKAYLEAAKGQFGLNGMKK